MIKHVKRIMPPWSEPKIYPWETGKRELHFPLRAHKGGARHGKGHQKNKDKKGAGQAQPNI